LLFPEAEVVEFDQAQFGREQAAWNASNVKNYHYNMYIDDLGSLSIIRFVIENGVLIKREIIESGMHDNHDTGFTTIPEFFDKIERTVQAARKEYAGRNPDDIRFVIHVDYNTEHHFPVSMRTSELHAIGNNTFTSGEGDGITCSIKDFADGN
jgi:hypothetical protein